MDQNYEPVVTCSPSPARGSQKRSVGPDDTAADPAPDDASVDCRQHASISTGFGAANSQLGRGQSDRHDIFDACASGANRLNAVVEPQHIGHRFRILEKACAKLNA